MHKNMLTNTQKYLDKYTKTFGQIHMNIWTNTQEHLDKYTNTVDTYTKIYKFWSVVRDYGLILWEIEAMPYILLLGMPKQF